MSRTTFPRRRGLVMAPALLVGLLAFPAFASAAVDGPCTGTVTIDGVAYSEDNDTAADPIVIPDREGLVADWSGRTTDGPITNHTGNVGLVIGPVTYQIEDWEGENAELAESSDGEYPIDDLKDQLPFELVGLYEVAGSHSGDGGTCDGSVMILVEGSAATTPVGAASIGGTLLAAVGVAAAGRKKVA